MEYGSSYTLVRRKTGWWKRKITPKAIEINAICSFLDNKVDSRILDFGCDTGFLLDIIRKKNPSKNFEFCGADINRYALNYARRKYRDFTFFSIDDEFFDNEKFDVIILSHVLEHIRDRDGFVKNLKKLLKEDGVLIIAIPQERIRGDCTIIELSHNLMKGDFENPHVVKINYQELNDLLANNGLHIEEHIYTHLFYPFKSDKRRFDSCSLVTTCNFKPY